MELEAFEIFIAVALGVVALLGFVGKTKEEVKVTELLRDRVDDGGDDAYDIHQQHLDHWHDDSAINPANGLPMIGGRGGIDVSGNPYGSDGDWD